MTKLDLNMYARLLANVACRPGIPLGRILVELGIDPAELHAAEASLRSEMAGLWDNRKGIVAMKFAATLGAELARLGPLGSPVAAPAQPVVAPVPAATPEGHGNGVPSYLHVPPLAARGPRPPLAGPPPAPYVEPLPPTAAAPVLRASKINLAGTADIDTAVVLASIGRGTLPFSPGQPSPEPLTPHPEAPGAARPPGPAPLPKVAASSPLGATMDPDQGKILAAIARGVLPFAPGAEPAQPPPQHPPAAASNPDASAILSGPPAAKPSVKPAATVELPVMDPAPEPTFPGPNSLDRYAAISGALARGLSREQALAANGSSPEDFDNLIRYWGPRFAQDEALLATFQEMAKSHAGLAKGAE